MVVREASLRCGAGSPKIRYLTALSFMSNGSDSSDSNQGRPQQVNLQKVAQDFMAGLQRHFDMLAFNLASREFVTEAAYDKRSNAPRVMPAAPRHQNFEQMQAYARDLMVRQVLGDALNLAVTALNNGHFFLALVEVAGGRSDVSDEARKTAQEKQRAFVNAQLDAKFDRLENDYGIRCELEDTVTSAGFAVRALLKHGGVVQADQVDDHGELGFDLKAVERVSGEGDGAPQGRLVDRRKAFQAGESVVFSDLELQLLLVTVGAFADGFFKSVGAYARERRSGGGE